jgi:hypothetical protein
MDKQKKIEKALEKTIKPEKIKPAIENMLFEQKLPVKEPIKSHVQKDMTTKTERRL